MASVETYELKSGAKRYRVHYREPSGRPREKSGFARKKDANDFITQVEHNKREGTYVDPTRGKTRFSEVAERYLAHTQRLRKRSWAARVESILRVHVLPRWGDQPVATIDRPELSSWLLGIERSASTVEDIHAVIHGVLELAVTERRIPSNVAHKLELPNRTPPERNYLTRPQLDELIAEVSRHSELVTLLGLVGLRWGEAVALRPMDIDLDRRRAHIRRSYSKVNNTHDLTTPKSWEQRTVALPTAVTEALAPLLEAAPNDQALLWSRPDGRPLPAPTTTGWYLKAVTRLVDRHTPRDTDGNPTGPSTFPRVTAHDLRHTAASLMVSAGASVMVVQRQLGHKSAAMTLDTYSDLFDADLDAIIDALG